ncbi:hypothetical protein TYRP_013284 [Tyrophagus putrescentiae]|nr:hypothetical protein TYRP_013284 [Tyrophagus putrescentiae]
MMMMMSGDGYGDDAKLLALEQGGHRSKVKCPGGGGKCERRLLRRQLSARAAMTLQAVVAVVAFAVLHSLTIQGQAGTADKRCFPQTSSSSFPPSSSFMLKPAIIRCACRENSTAVPQQQQ